jgi:hypothetical protein
MLPACREALNRTNGLHVQLGGRAECWARGQIVHPPDTSMTAPLMYDASSDASHA